MAVFLLCMVLPVVALGSPPDSVGQEVQAKGAVAVLSTPEGPVLGSQPDGSKGKIVDGPVDVHLETSTARLWKVAWASGPDGWCVDLNLHAASPPKPPVSLWKAPKTTQGERLEPLGAAYTMALVEGRKPEGRQASLDPASVLPLAALRELQKGDAVNIPLFGGETVSGFVVASKFEENGWLRLSIKLVGDRKGFVGFGSNGKKFGGTIDFPGEQIACRIMERPDGGMVVKEVARSEILCIMPARKSKASKESRRAPLPRAEPPRS